MKRLCCFLSCVSLLIFFFSTASFADSSNVFFRKHKASIYQVQVIDRSSARKRAIGSGFALDKQGFIATNYHVISLVLSHPQRYELKVLNAQEQKIPAVVIDVDVVHDLAVIKIEQATKSFLMLGSSKMEKGATLYSLGNPHDLGLAIIKGLHNGYLEKSMYEKIHFSGSLNPGMSGGPAIRSDGTVAGINVATAGNQISFLVPVEFLSQLYGRLKHQKSETSLAWNTRIEEQLAANQRMIFEHILSNPWERVAMGPYQVPGEFSDKFHCWGDTDASSKSWLIHHWSRCASRDSIFLTDRLSTGKIGYGYVVVRSQTYEPFRFYNLYQQLYAQEGLDFLSSEKNKEDELEEENFFRYACTQEFVRIHQKDYKARICSRQYRRYPQLYDMALTLARIEQGWIGFIAHLSGQGVLKEQMKELYRRFMEQIR